jgi:uncharacterized protein YndB with AHSA1/START domain/mannose-6-phosphate isomerase-like protein (cupin superfamily)
MAKSGDVLEIPEMGFEVTFLRTGADTGGDVSEFEVSGRFRGFLTRPHVHPNQTEHIEVSSGALKVAMDGATQVLDAGDAITIPPGTPHTQVSVGTDPATFRITHTPAGRSEAFIEKVAALSREGRIVRGGWPRPTAAAELTLEFGDSGRAAKPPPSVQRAVARGILGAASAGRAARERASKLADNEYLFVDEWDVAAPPQAVFDALADARTYPRWWTPVYIDVDADGPPVLGKVSKQHFKGRLPYHLHTQSKITRLEPPHVVQGDVEGDLRGRGTWTLTPTATGTHVRFDWRVYADRKLLRALTPVLRPAFRWNHNWAIERAMDGLEPFAQRS